MRDHPNRSELLSALGVVSADLTVTDSDLGGERRIDAGDAFLLCTDGIWEHIDDDVLEALLNAAPSPAGWLAAIEASVRAATRDRSSYDNFTALAVSTDPATDADSASSTPS